MNILQRLTGRNQDIVSPFPPPERLEPERPQINPLQEIGKRVGQKLLEARGNLGQGVQQQASQPLGEKMRSFFNPPAITGKGGGYRTEPRVFGDVAGAGTVTSQTTSQPIPQATPTQTAQPQQQRPLTPEDRAEIIRRGYSHWGDVPAIQWAGTFAQAPDIADVFVEHPYLPAAVALAESSGGKNITYENNPMNWGINVPSFQPQSPEEAIMKMMTGVGHRMDVYEPFRESQDIRDFAYIHTPPNENDTEKYINDLINIMSIFQQAEEKYRRNLYGR